MSNRATFHTTINFLALCIVAFLMGVSISTLTRAADVVQPQTTTQTLGFTFTQDLSYGYDNEDVRQLQILLNKDPDTQVALTGSGSPGQENTYFGAKTKAAVIRFQRKYSIEVLRPFKLDQPTGFVGASTRKKLNQLLAQYASNQNPVTTNTTISNGVSVQIPTAGANNTSVTAGSILNLVDKLPRVYAATPYQIRKGSTLHIIGDGFTLDNTLHIGSYTFDHVAPLDNTNLELFIASTSTIPNGQYKISVENTNGSSVDHGPSIFLTITDTPLAQPTIISVSPATTTLNGMVTVTGSGFNSTENKIVSTFGTFEHFSATGNTITFSPSQIIDQAIINRYTKGKTITVTFYIVSGNMPTVSSGSFNVSL